MGVVGSVMGGWSVMPAIVQQLLRTEVLRWPAGRPIIRIDEELCTGCGECVPACAEGALEIVNGKVRVVSEVLCDGLGACLGECPEGALLLEERPAPEFDEGAVEKR